LIWKVARAPSRRAVILATIASMLAVQALYQSMFMLIAFCLGGALLAAGRRDFKRALLVLALIVPPALSLLPYLGVIGRANQWNVVTEVPLGLSRIWLVFQRALSAPGPLMFWLWAALLLAAIVTGCVVIAAKTKTSASNDDRDVAWFLVTVIVAATSAYYLFLTLLKFPTEVWYYLAWMGVVAVGIDALLSRIIREDRVRVVRLAGVVLLAVIMSPGIWQQAQVRMTNLDLVATRLNREAGNDDLILMHPWFCGPAFGRYYKSKAPWLTLPPLADQRLQRLDLFKEQMQQDAPIQPVLEKMEATLRDGHVVWLIGYYPFSNPPRIPPPLPRAGEGPGGWNEAPYMTVYGMQVAYFLQAHALETKSLKLDSTQAVNPFEHFPVTAVSGWRSSRF
jgi:multidrug transporter EmrE-like cation transporter